MEYIPGETKLEFVPGKSWVPIYVVKTEKETGKVLAARWLCPHCGESFRSRSSCKKHCTGSIGSYVATCPYLPIHQCSPNCKIFRHPGRKYVNGPKLNEEQNANG